jgi:hypothetical protein
MRLARILSGWWLRVTGWLEPPVWVNDAHDAVEGVQVSGGAEVLRFPRRWE